MINVKHLKENMSATNIIKILEHLGAECRKQSDNELIFTSICHHGENASCHKAKLYYYPDTHSFVCYSCGWQGDIFDLVQKVNNAIFVEALAYICEILDVTVGYTAYNVNPHVYNWRKDCMPYINKDYRSECELTVYNEDLLNFFEDAYPLSWILEGISADTLQRYEIKYYPLHNSVVIPCRDECGNLIGIRERFLNPEDCINGKYKPLTMLSDNLTFKFPTNQMFYGIYNNLEAIKRRKTVWLVEGEKSVLKADTWFGNDNVALAMYGLNLGENRRDFLVSLGVEEVVIMIDNDFQTKDSEEYGLFWQRVKKIAKLLKGFCTVSVCYNNQGYDMYKSNPFDITQEEFEILYDEREYIV